MPESPTAPLLTATETETEPIAAQITAPGASSDSEEQAKEALLCRAARYAWALLLARIDEVFPLVCPRCGGERRIIAFLTDACAVREILSHLGKPTSPPPIAPAPGPPLWEITDAEQGEFGPPAQPAPDDPFDQRIAWERPHEDDPIGLVRERLHHGLPRRPSQPPRRPMAIMAILMLRFWRGFQAPSARFPRITTAVRAYQSLEHWRKWRWISYPCEASFRSRPRAARSLDGQDLGFSATRLPSCAAHGDADGESARVPRLAPLLAKMSISTWPHVPRRSHAPDSTSQETRQLKSFMTELGITISCCAPRNAGWPKTVVSKVIARVLPVVMGGPVYCEGISARNRSVVCVRSNWEEATSSSNASHASLSGAGSMPFRRRNTMAEAIATRLFPSLNG